MYRQLPTNQFFKQKSVDFSKCKKYK